MGSTIEEEETMRRGEGEEGDEKKLGGHDPSTLDIYVKIVMKPLQCII
jgi:hypothetical protein